MLETLRDSFCTRLYTECCKQKKHTEAPPTTEEHYYDRDYYRRRPASPSKSRTPLLLLTPRVTNPLCGREEGAKADTAAPHIKTRVKEQHQQRWKKRERGDDRAQEKGHISDNDDASAVAQPPPSSKRRQPMLNTGVGTAAAAASAQGLIQPHTGFGTAAAAASAQGLIQPQPPAKQNAEVVVSNAVAFRFMEMLADESTSEIARLRAYDVIQQKLAIVTQQRAAAKAKAESAAKNVEVPKVSVEFAARHMEAAKAKSDSVAKIGESFKRMLHIVIDKQTSATTADTAVLQSTPNARPDCEKNDYEYSSYYSAADVFFFSRGIGCPTPVLYKRQKHSPRDRTRRCTLQSCPASRSKAVVGTQGGPAGDRYTVAVTPRGTPCGSVGQPKRR